MMFDDSWEENPRSGKSGMPGRSAGAAVAWRDGWAVRRVGNIARQGWMLPNSPDARVNRRVASILAPDPTQGALAEHHLAIPTGEAGERAGVRSADASIPPRTRASSVLIPQRWLGASRRRLRVEDHATRGSTRAYTGIALARRVFPRIAGRRRKSARATTRRHRTSRHGRHEDHGHGNSPS